VASGAGDGVLGLLRGAVLLVFALAADLLAALELQTQLSDLLEERKRFMVLMCGLQVCCCCCCCDVCQGRGAGGACEIGAQQEMEQNGLY